jgi:hypothetical protein
VQALKSSHRLDIWPSEFGLGHPSGFLNPLAGHVNTRMNLIHKIIKNYFASKPECSCFSGTPEFETLPAILESVLSTE